VLKNYVPEHYHRYLDVFTEKEAIPLPLHQSWDHVITLTPDAPPSISCRVYLLSCGEEEFQVKYIKEQEDASLIQKLKSLYSTPSFTLKRRMGVIVQYSTIERLTLSQSKMSSPSLKLTRLLKKCMKWYSSVNLIYSMQWLLEYLKQQRNRGLNGL